MTTSLLAQIDWLMCVHFLFIFYLTPPEKSSLKSVARRLKSSTFLLSGNSVKICFPTIQLQNTYYEKKETMGVCFMAARLLFQKNLYLYKTEKTYTKHYLLTCILIHRANIMVRAKALYPVYYTQVSHGCQHIHSLAMPCTYFSFPLFFSLCNSTCKNILKM